MTLAIKRLDHVNVRTANLDGDDPSGMARYCG